jgi:membrane-bound lytic murein transglycosylase F
MGIINAPVCRTYKNISLEKGSDSISSKSADLSQIIARKRLVALTYNSSTSYFLYKGEPMGYEYEMLKAFSKTLDVELKIIVAKNIDEIFDLLRKGKVDLIAANLTITEDRMKEVNFSDPLLYTRQVLVQQKPKGWEKMTTEKLEKYLIRNTIDMAGKNIYVRKGSSFYARLSNLQEEIASKINIVELPGDINTEEMIGMVAGAKISYTIADENVAMVNQTYYPNIDVKTAISFPQKIAWAVNKNSPLLLAGLNKWIKSQKNTAEYANLYNKYFKNPKGSGQRNGSEFSSMAGNKISPYDDMIIAYSREIEWDWRLLASMIYQESKFDPNAESWAGACGLMQLTPSTAGLYGIDTCGATPIQSIEGGTRHIVKLNKYWSKFITSKQERIKFVLASYNVGLGHIIDARNLAKKYGKNPDLWYNNVETYILLKSKPKYYNDPIVRCGYCRGQEPYNYVRQIIERYDHYKNTIISNDWVIDNINL